MNVFIISPFKGDFEFFNKHIKKTDDINIIYQKYRFEYLKFIDKVNNVFCIRDFNIFSFEKNILKEFDNFIFYSDISALYSIKFSDISTDTIRKDRFDDLFYFANMWDNIMCSYFGKLFPGFLHNISSPVTALSGKFSIAKLMNKTLEVDEKLFDISDKILQLIKNFQFIFESSTYLEPQNIDLIYFIENMKDVFNANLKFKHNIKFILNNKKSFFSFSILPYSIFFYLYLIFELIDFIKEEKITLNVDISNDSEENFVSFQFDFKDKFNFMNYNSFNSLDLCGLSIEKIYLLWNYLIPSNIIINTDQYNSTNIVKIIYK